MPDLKNITTCPPTEELRELIASALPSEEQAACTAHLDSCSSCQAKLEELATEGTNLSQVVERLHAGDPQATSAYWPALQAAALQVHQAETLQPTPRRRERSLDFLQPATDSAYLGRVAHFDIMRLLGQGGMGMVLEACDSRLQRHVAIKVLDPELA